MSSSDNTVAVLKRAEVYLFQIGGPILVFIGTVGSLLNLLVFTQKNLRKNPCSIYFIAFNLSNLLYIYAALFFTTLSIGYQISPIIYNLPFCRISLYIRFLSYCLGPFYLILAGIDRILITSQNALTRQKSTRRLAYICIGVGTLFWALFHCYTLILANITTIANTISYCYYPRGVASAFYSYYSIVQEILDVLLMIFCGVWSIRNIRNAHRVVAATDVHAGGSRGRRNSLQSSASKDRQMILMLLIDICIRVLFSFVFAISLVYSQITQYYVKSSDRMQIEAIVQYIFGYCMAVPYCISCYTNLIMSKTYRKEMQKLLVWR